MAIKVSDPVKKDQLVFSDKTMPAARFTMPGTGFLKAMHRGERRTLISVVIELSGTEEVVFNSYSCEQLSELNRQQIINQLLESGFSRPLLPAFFLPSKNYREHGMDSG